MVWHQEEPIVSTGPYAQWCVMRSAREQVTVLLDGQGGDELIAGYVPYQLVYLRQLRKERKYGLLREEATASRDVLMPLARRRIEQRRKQLPSRKLLRQDFLARTTDPGYGRSQSDLKERLLQDLLTYSLPCLLRYEDRNSMAFSIESRVPYLDQEFVDHILSLPEDAIVRHGWSRWILRAALGGHAAGEDPPAPLEGRVHDAGDALDQGPPRRVHQPLPVADVPGATVLGRRRRGERVPRLLPRRGGGEHVFLARRQHRAVAARVRGHERGARGRRRGGGAQRAGPRRPGAPREHRGSGRRPGAGGAAAGGGNSAPLRPPRPGACWPGSRRTRRSTCSASPAAPSSPVCRCTPTSSRAATTWTTSCGGRSLGTSGPATSWSWPRSPSPPARAAATLWMRSIRPGWPGSSARP